jgi:predicted nicotinamide N-methyase
MAHAAIQLNAQHNQVAIEAVEIDMEKPFKKVDLILAGDVCYQQAMSAKVMRWLILCREEGARVLLADPGRAYVPEQGLRKVTQYDVPTSRDLEDRDVRTVVIWEME